MNQKHLDMKKTRKKQVIYANTEKGWKRNSSLTRMTLDDSNLSHFFSSHNVGAMETYAVAAAWVDASKSKGSSSSDISDKPGQS